MRFLERVKEIFSGNTPPSGQNQVLHGEIVPTKYIVSSNGTQTECTNIQEYLQTARNVAQLTPKQVRSLRAKYEDIPSLEQTEAQKQIGVAHEVGAASKDINDGIAAQVDRFLEQASTSQSELLKKGLEGFNRALDATGRSIQEPPFEKTTRSRSFGFWNRRDETIKPKLPKQIFNSVKINIPPQRHDVSAKLTLEDGQIIEQHYADGWSTVVSGNAAFIQSHTETGNGEVHFESRITYSDES